MVDSTPSLDQGTNLDQGTKASPEDEKTMLEAFASVAMGRVKKHPKYLELANRISGRVNQEDIQMMSEVLRVSTNEKVVKLGAEAVARIIATRLMEIEDPTLSDDPIFKAVADTKFIEAVVDHRTNLLDVAQRRNPEDPALDELKRLKDNAWYSEYKSYIALDKLLQQPPPQAQPAPTPGPATGGGTPPPPGAR